MSWVVLALLAGCAATAIILAVKVGDGDRYGWDTTRMLLVCTGGVFIVATLVLGGVMLGRGLDRHFAHQGCHAYGEQTSRQVRWVDASYFDYGCYVLWNNTWIPRDDYIRLTFGQETGAER